MHKNISHRSPPADCIYRDKIMYFERCTAILCVDIVYEGFVLMVFTFDLTFDSISICYNIQISTCSYCINSSFFFLLYYIQPDNG